MKRLIAIAWVLASLPSSCFSQSSGRSFLMGTSSFFISPFVITPDLAGYPAWKFENLGDKDILSLHVDDNHGIPWANFQNGTPPPATWAAKWTNLKSSAAATGKILYLSVSPLTNRKRLTTNVDASGNLISNWDVVDSSGCYAFSTDAQAASFQAAYIQYSKYVIDLVQPRFFSPAVEINLQFSQCPAQKAAWINWYNGVHNAIKQAYPNLVVFPTFQMEVMYGACGCSTPSCFSNCFQTSLNEALTIPGDRIAFAMFPITWELIGDSITNYDPFAQVQASTSRKIWVSETGFYGVQVLSSYSHASPPSSCGSVVYPASIANDAKISNYMTWLLQQAQAKKLEAVIWWLNRDYLDGPVAADCPCSPAGSDTCRVASIAYDLGGSSLEFLIRYIGNMGLRYYDGTARPAYSTWNSYYALPLISSQTIPTGGSAQILYQAYKGEASLLIPQGAFSSPTDITLSMPSSFPSASLSQIPLTPTNVGVQIDTSQSLQPVLDLTLAVSYKDAGLSGFSEAQFILARYDAVQNVWVPLVSSVDAANKKVTARTNHLSLFQVMQAAPSAAANTVKVFPNPLRPSQGHNSMTFMLLPANARIRIYTLKGGLVKDLTADTAGMASWDGTNESGQKVASGVYFAFAQGAGENHTFKLAIQR